MSFVPVLAEQFAVAAVSPVPPFLEMINGKNSSTHCAKSVTVPLHADVRFRGI
jgi:hypothetical protein